MSGFLAVLLQNDLQFSSDHLNDIQSKMSWLHQVDEDYKNIYHDDQLVLGFRGARYHVAPQKFDQQPYFFGDQYIMLFNGKVYNAEELLRKLQNKGYNFKTRSELEVIATLFLDKGVDCFNELRGMFAIIIWDGLNKRMYGARDSFGIKPLYYSENNEEIMFASEKKSTLFSTYHESVNRDALQYYLTYQYVPEPLTLHEGIQKIKPGHYFIKDMNQPIQMTRYFHATFQPVHNEKKRMMSRIQDVLMDSVQMHMQTDGSVGAFLSGGIDSSIIVSLAKEVDPNIKTFTVGFGDDGYSEIDFAKKTAEKLDVEHFAYRITPHEYIEALPIIMWHMDDPLADPSSVPLYFAAREAKKQVGAVLSGEGADELFGGYNIYREPHSLKLFEYIPKQVNDLLYRLATVIPEGFKGKSFLMRGTTPLKDRYIGNAKMFEESEKRQFLKHYNDQISYRSITEQLFVEALSTHAIDQMQYIDLHTWLPGDILLKADKMTKAHSLQLRVPFLDKNVFEVARTIPACEKVTNRTTKTILRESFKDRVPHDVLYRKKLGFPVPIKHWLKNGVLYDWARQLIQDSETEHFLDKNYVLSLLEQHAKNKGDYARKIWTVLMFMLWHQIYIERKYVFDEVALA